MMRNDNTSNKKKYLGITSHAIRIPDNWYVDYFGQRILVKDILTYHQNKPSLHGLYYHYTLHD